MGCRLAHAVAALIGVALSTAPRLEAAPSRADALVVVATHIANSKEPLLGYLARPDGTGRLPAVVVLHGCDGFHWNMAVWASRLKDWGYVALAIDSLAPRHIDNGCEGGANDEPIDAFAALRYLQARHYVDPMRVAVLGFSRGGGAALMDVDTTGLAKLFPTRFRAAVAYYPDCRGVSGVMTAPTLILGAAEDDWLPVQACRDMMARRNDKGPLVTLVVYPHATHAFNIDAPPRVYLGHHLQYDPDAAKSAESRVRTFLHDTLPAPSESTAP